MTTGRLSRPRMSLEGQVAYGLLLLVVYLLLPLGLMLILWLMSRRYGGMFDEIGFSRKEMGLLLVGSLSVLLVPVDVPVFAYERYFLALNVGGALIPVILSAHLFRAKKIPLASGFFGVLGVSLITFFVTRVQPESGIVAEFPWLLLPSLSATVLALLLFSRDSAKTPAYAYGTATLGSLVGADIFHMPELFQTPRFAGSIGGAGVFDLVYIAGILSITLVLLFGSQRLRRIRRAIPHSELAQERVAWELRTSLYAIWMQQYQMSVQRTLAAVQERIRQVGEAFGAYGPFPGVLARVVPNPTAVQQYHALAAQANNATATYPTAYWAMGQAQGILAQLQTAERSRFASVARRVGAFSVDGIFIAGIIIGLYYGVSLLGRLADPEVLVLTFVFWAWATQLFYFTIFEYLWKGFTPGKRIFGIRVADRHRGRLDFITVFTRNVVRIFDFVAFLYLVALFVMARSERIQRPGDMVADTVVLRVRRSVPMGSMGSPTSRSIP